MNLFIQTELDDFSGDLARMTMEAGSAYLAYRLGIFESGMMLVADDCPFIGQVPDRGDDRFLIAAIGGMTAAQVAGFDGETTGVAFLDMVAVLRSEEARIPDVETTRRFERAGLEILLDGWDKVLALRDALIRKHVLLFSDVVRIVNA